MNAITDLPWAFWSFLMFSLYAFYFHVAFRRGDAWVRRRVLGSPPGTIRRGAAFGMLHAGGAVASMDAVVLLAAILPATEWAANVSFVFVVLAIVDTGIMVRRIFSPRASQMPDWLREEGL